VRGGVVDGTCNSTLHSISMRATDVRRLRKRLGLTQARFGRLLGVHRVTVARWESGVTEVQAPVAKLIRIIVKAKS
jgi:DNA-binding transcriptional regulator YiaG